MISTFGRKHKVQGSNTVIMSWKSKGYVVAVGTLNNLTAEE